MNSDAPAETLHTTLARMGAPEGLAEPLLAALGPDAGRQLTEDPWRLLRLPRVTPEQADYCARHLLGEDFGPDDPRRGRALVAHLLRRAARQGHTALDHDRLAGALRRLGARFTETALTAALDDGDVLEFEGPAGEDDPADAGDEEPPEPERRYALATVGLAEQELGEGLARLSATSEPIMDAATAAETVERAAARHGVDLPPEVEAALATVALRGVCVVTHGAGASAALARFLTGAAAIAGGGGGIVVAAPTASGVASVRAALREALSPAAAAEVPVVSLGQLLEPHRGGGFGRGAARPIEVTRVAAADAPEVADGGELAGIVVVTDAMALDVELAATLVESCTDGTHLVLVADPDEAPSAAPGRVVADVVASGTVPVARLPAAADPGPLARLATTVAGGELGRVEAPEREVVVVPAGSPGEAAHRAMQLVTDSIPRVLGIAPAGVVLVTGTRGGECGSAALNAACKERLNPGPGAYGGFDPGDRVLLAGAGPGYLAGDSGVLREVTADGAVVELDDAEPGAGRAVDVADPALLRPGWAMPVSVAHGGHWPAVVAVFGPGMRAFRPQVYTALTRARHHLSIVHAAGPALARAVREVPTMVRHTRLVDVLREG